MNYKYAISANADLREKMKAAGVTFWQIADVLGVSEMTASRRFRKELSAQDKEKYSKIIDNLAAQKKEVKQYV